MSRLNGNFIGMNWETLLAAKNTEYEIAALQMLNNNYRNEHLQRQKPQHQAQAKREGLTRGSIFQLPVTRMVEEMRCPSKREPGQPRFPRDSEAPKLLQTQTVSGAVHSLCLNRSTYTRISRQLLEDLRKRFLGQQVFLPIFMDYIQQFQSPCPPAPSIWRGSTRSPHT